jgi:hypothetical protein
VVIYAYNHHVRLLSPEPWSSTKVYSGSRSRHCYAIKWISLTIGGLFSFHDAEIITALAELTGDTFLAELALPIVELGSGDYPSS